MVLEHGILGGDYRSWAPTVQVELVSKGGAMCEALDRLDFAGVRNLTNG